MANYIAKGRQVVIPLTNKAANAVEYGDVVILDTTATESFDVTTTGAYSGSWIGVVVDQDGIAVDAVGRVCVSGYVPQVNLDGAAAIGDYLFTDTVAEQGSPNAVRGEGAFGQALEAGAAPSAYIWGNPDGAGGGGGDVATDDIWDAAGDLVQGTGANTAAKLSIGTYPQILRVNSGATAVEWVSAGKVLILEQTPGATTTVTWSSIPTTYKHLEIVFIARSTKAAVTFEDFSIFFNNDTTANNYSYGLGFFYTSNATGSQSVASGSVCAILSAANSSAGQATSGVIKIPYYQTSFYKQSISDFTHARDQSSVFTLRGVAGSSWENTAAINRVDLVLASGNFVAGSTFALYGVF